MREAAVLAMVLVGGAVAAAPEREPPKPPEPSAARQAELRYLLRHDCGSCHGMTLRGGLGPPLLAPALAGKPTEDLLSAVLDGRPGTPMPPWRGLLSEPDARWLVEVLRAGLAEPGKGP